MSPNDFALYTIDGNWTAGFATRAKGPMLYIMVPEILDDFDDRLGRRRVGEVLLGVDLFHLRRQVLGVAVAQLLDGIHARGLEQLAVLRPDARAGQTSDRPRQPR